MSSTSESQKKESLESRLLFNNYIQLSIGKRKKRDKWGRAKPMKNLAKGITQNDVENTAQRCEEPHDSI